MTDKIISSLSAQWFVRRLLEMDVRLERILYGTNLSRTWLDNPYAMIYSSQYVQIIKNALNIRSWRPSLGFIIGRGKVLNELGVWPVGLISSSKLEEAADISLQFYEKMGSLVKIVKSEEDGFVNWVIQPNFHIEDSQVWIYAVEGFLTATQMGGCILSNRQLQYDKICLSYPKPVYWNQYQEFFKCPITFDCKKDIMWYPCNYNDIPISTRHVKALDLFRMQYQKTSVKLRKEEDDLINNIWKIIKTIISKPNSSLRIDEVAKRLAISSRTLERRLRERNTTYRDILDEVRTELAKELLLTTSLSVDQIANLIGFSETSTFRHVFKKWTGLNIREFKMGKTL